MILGSEIVPCSKFDDELIADAYDLYRGYYAPTDPDVFSRDFRAKHYAVLIRNGRKLVGFSTVERIRLADGIRVLFSGDTVVEQSQWGSQVLPHAWLREAGRIWLEDRQAPLYWMLITKGHRTYRYLPAFSRSYHPARGISTPPSVQTLIDRLSEWKFGERYDGATGTVRADPRLPTHVAEPFSGQRSNKHVDFFVERNPGHARGDELVTLCRLAPETLTLRARRQFLAEVEAA